MPYYSDPGYYYGSSGYSGGGGYSGSSYTGSSYSGYGSGYSGSWYPTSSGYPSYSSGSSYYSPNSGYSSYGSSYSRNLPTGYIPPSTRSHISAKYKPKLTTISETGIVTRKSTGMSPLTRISSPKVSYHTSPKFQPPRPIPINTADIDVSAGRYKKRDKASESEEEQTNEPSRKKSDYNNNNNNSKQNSPFMPRVDGVDPSTTRCTIKRDRAVVRLSTIRPRNIGKGSKGSRKDEKKDRVPSVKKTKPTESDQQQSVDQSEKQSWRDRFRDDLSLKFKEPPKKSPGELLLERFLIPDKDKENDSKFVDLSKTLGVPEDQVKDTIMHIDGLGEDAIRRFSLSKCPSFQDICEDISSDKLDDDLNAGDLRRRASLIQEQEIEIINQLQKSGSGTIQQYIIEHPPIEEDRKSVKRKSKKPKKIRTKITATVGVENSPAATPVTPLTPIIVDDIRSPVEKKLKVNVEELEEDHTIHKIFKLPKKKSEENLDKAKTKITTAKIDDSKNETKIKTLEKKEDVKSPKIDDLLSTPKNMEAKKDVKPPNLKIDKKEGAKVDTTTKSPEKVKTEKKEDFKTAAVSTLDKKEEVKSSIQTKTETKIDKKEDSKDIKSPISKIDKRDELKSPITPLKTIGQEEPKSPKKITTKIDNKEDAKTPVITPKIIKKDDVKTPLKTPTKIADTTPKSPPKLADTTPKTPTKFSEATPKTPPKLPDTTPKTPTKLSEATPKTPPKLPDTTPKTPTKLSEATPKTPIKLPELTPKTPLQKSILETNFKKSTAPEHFTFDTDTIAAHSSPEKPGTPKTPKSTSTPKKSAPNSPKTPILQKTNPEEAKPTQAVKLQKSDSGEDFWAQIGHRETIYMTNRKKNVIEKQWARRESLLEDDELSYTGVHHLEEIKEKLETQKTEDLQRAENAKPKSALFKRGESTDSTLHEEKLKSSIKDKKDALSAKKAQIQSPKTAKLGQANPISEKAQTKPPTNDVKAITLEKKTTDTKKSITENKLDETNLSSITISKTDQLALQKLKENTSQIKSTKESSPIIATTTAQATSAAITTTTTQPPAIKSKTPTVDNQQSSPPPKTPSGTNLSNTDASQQSSTKINAGLKAKSPEIKINEQEKKNVKELQLPTAEENFVRADSAKPSAPIVLTEDRQKSPKSKAGNKTTADLAKQSIPAATPPKKADVKVSASKELGRPTEDAKQPKAKPLAATAAVEQANTDKIRSIETRSSQDNKTKTGSKEPAKRSNEPIQPAASAPKVDVIITKPEVPEVKLPKSVTDNDKQQRPPTVVVDKISNDATKPIIDDKPKDELSSSKVLGANVQSLSKFPSVSQLNRCLADVDAELSDYIPSDAPDSDSSYEDDSTDDSMKKRNRHNKDDGKFNPNQVVKLNHKAKCYVKPEAPKYPLYATPRPLWKREKVVYSDSESDDSDSDSECSTSDESSDELNPTKDGLIRMSTCSNDSGFEGGTAPSSPKKMLGAHDARDSPSIPPSLNPAFKIDTNYDADDLETSHTFSQFQKSGRITAPATMIPRFKKYAVEDFHFLAVLGKGSFGKVLLAELRNTEYYYAVKCLKKDVVLEDDDVECTLIERKVLAMGTKHPYLCHLFCTFQTESHLFFVMEYLNGGDLMFHIQQSGRFPEVRARFYAAEIISGLKFLHKKGIIYRDLKLDNVLLDFDGHVRIADFGMCKLQIYLDKTADSFCGTPDYMAPEIIKGEKYNQNVDWWSFGVLLYEMLVGQSPFSGCDEDELFWSICNELPWFPIFVTKEATDLLKGLLEKNSAARIGSQYSPLGDICSHKFFDEIDWNSLERRTLDPPFKPQVKHPLDTQYFDKAFTRERVRLTPIDKEILRSMDQEQFQGFSYTNPNATIN